MMGTYAGLLRLTLTFGPESPMPKVVSSAPSSAPSSASSASALVAGLLALLVVVTGCTIPAPTGSAG